MASIWKENKDVTQHPRRNNFDLSYASHCTFKFGYLYPVFKKKVVPGDSFRIDSAFDIKMMPVSFPVQSRMRAHLHFFYVRNKNLWDNWEDWISGLKDNDTCPHPYISVPDSEITTGSIHDFLGQPTTAVTPSGISEQLVPFAGYRLNGAGMFDIYPLYYVVGGWNVGTSESSVYQTGTSASSVVVSDVIHYPLDNEKVTFDVSTVIGAYLNEYFTAITTKNFRLFVDGVSSASYSFTYEDGTLTFGASGLNAINAAVDSGSVVKIWFYPVSVDSVPVFPSYSTSTKDLTTESFTFTASIATGVQQLSDLNLGFSTQVPLSALPYRAYESIYRSFYANSVLQPLVINGVKEYNKFNTTTADGADSTDYHLFMRNYEMDYLTSCLPSPQAGPAPVVGMTALGNITIEDENGITTAHATTDDTGVITGVQVTSPLASVEHGRMLLDIADVGMNINDFRNTNALQKFLEQTLRSGYRYIDFIKGHFGKSPEYRELDMPEFIGGFSRDINVSTVVATSDTADLGGSGTGKDLGSFGGFGRLAGGSNHSITHYCDDYGWIMGVLSITPSPAYSQLLPKENICPANYLDYYFPEFSQLGLQPVPYKEVAPVQTLLAKLSDPSVSLEDTFGYQRPNYDMVGSVDEVHGEFRNTLKDYLINRIFDGRPELGDDFLKVNPSEINDIFINQNPDNDVFIGHIGFRVKTKRPLPRVHIPGLGL